VSRVCLRPVFCQCVHLLNSSDEDTGKVLDVGSLLGKAVAQPDDRTTYRAFCAIADDRGYITQLVGYC
jgi:hypothetical protein